MFTELPRRMPDFELAAEPARMKASFIAGVRRLPPLTFTPTIQSPST